MNKWLRRLGICAALAMLVAADFLQLFPTIVYALDDIEARETYENYEIEYKNVRYDGVSTPQRETVNRKPTKIKNGKRDINGYEILSKRSENSKSYITNTDEMVTEVYLETMHKKIDDIYVDIDNKLEESDDLYRNKVGIYDVNFYKNDKYLYAVSNLNDSIKTRFDGANTKDYSVQDNRITYVNAYDDIDLEYIVGNSYLKENIVFNAPAKSNQFSYIINTGGLNVKKQDSYLCLYDSGDCKFELRAPYMQDKENNFNPNVSIDFEKISSDESKVILTYDTDWLNASERVYPVKLDPTVVPTNGTVNIDSSYIRNSNVNTTSNYYHMFVGYDKDGFASQAGYSIGMTRSFLAFNMPNIGDHRVIESATLELDRVNNYGITDIDVYKTANYVNPENITWANQPTNLTLVSNNSVAASFGFKSFDITSYIEDLNAGNQKTLMLKAQNESTSNYPAVFNTQHDSPDSVPKITITHRPDYDVDEDLDINTFDNSLRVYAKGLNEFRAVSMDGIARPNSNVQFKLYKKDSSGAKTHLKDFNSTSQSGLYFSDPIYVTNPMSGVQTYLKDNINYTSDYHNNGEFSLYDTIYGYNIVVQNSSVGNSTRDYETDEFIIYKVKLGDNLSSIAAHYGVPIDRLIADNNLAGVTIKEDDTLFIRLAKNNPKLTPDMYKPKSTISVFKAEFEYLGPSCRYACQAGDPINLFTGNFYYETKDTTLKDFADITLTRNYNAKAEKYSTMFGRGWTFNYDKSIAYDRDGNMLFFRGDGSIIKFSKSGDSFVPDITDYYEIIKNGQEIHVKDLIDRKTYIFDRFGVLANIVDKNGNRITVTRDEIGNIAKISIDGNKEISFEYNSYNMVSKIKLPSGDEINYGYNNNRELVKLMDAVGNEEKYSYDDKSRIAKITNRNNVEVANNTYDNDDRVTRQVDPNGDAYEFSYGDKQTTLKHNGSTETVHYDDNRRLTKQVFDDGTSIERTYDARDNITAEINENGQSKTYEYDNVNNLTKIVDYNGDTTTYTYDNNANMTSQTNSSGETEHYTYDANNNLVKYIDNANLATTYAYNANNERIRETDHLGNVTTYTHDKGNLKTIQHPNGLLETFYYDSMGNLIKQEDNSGRSEQYIYDANSNVVRQIDSYGQKEEYSYDGLGNKTEYVNKLGGKTTYSYDKLGRLEREQSGKKYSTFEYNMDGQVVKESNEIGDRILYGYDKKGRLTSTFDRQNNYAGAEYDSVGNLTKETDVFGNETSYQYNTRGLLVKKIASGVAETYEYDARNRLTKTIYDNGTTEESIYDESNNLVKKVDDNGNVTEYTYDNNRNVTSEKQTIDGKTLITTNAYSGGLLRKSTDFAGKITNYAYDAFGRLTSERDSLGKIENLEYDLHDNIIRQTNENSEAKTTTYDLLGRKTSETDFLNNKTEFAHDADGNITATTDALGNKETTTYDNFGNKLAFTNKNGHQTTYEYNNAGLLSKESDAYGVKTEYKYNDQNQLKNVYRDGALAVALEYDKYGRTIVENQLGEEILYSYDKHSNLTKEENKKSGITTNFTYDKYDNKITEENNYNIKNSYAYDKTHRLIKTTDKNGRSETIKYDGRDNIIEKTSFDNIKIVNGYDDYGRLVLANEKGLTTVNKYDAHDRVVEKIVNDAKTYKNIYDSNNRVVAEIDPMGHRTEHVFDAVGNEIQAIDKNGNSTAREYDAIGNITREIDARGNAKTFKYDIYDNIIRETDANGKYDQYKYNSLGQILEKVDKSGYRTEYKYNDKFQLVKTTYPYGFTEEYSYDTHGNPSKMKLKNGAIIEYAYDLGGNVISEKDPNGNTTTRQYDDYGNMTEEKNALGYVVRYNYNDRNLLTEKADNTKVINAYTYDNNGQMTREIDANKNAKDYTYDAFGNVVSESTDTKKLTKKYDLNDNLIDENLNDKVISTYTYDPNGNRLTERKNGRLVKETKYDPAGNITYETNEESVVIEKDYDANNRPVSVSLNSKPIFSYTYDAKDNITEEKLVTGAVRKYEYDAYDQLTAKIDANNNTSRYEYDSVGNVAKVIDPSGNIIKYSYDRNNNLLDKDFHGAHEMFRYDAGNRLIQQNDQYGAVTRYSYDDRNNLTSEIKPGNVTINYEYDYLGNLREKTAQNINIKFEYNSDNLMTRMTDNVGVSTYRYDDLDNLVEYINPHKRTIKYGYDAFNNNTAITYPDKKTVTYEYNDKNQVSKISENGRDIVSYAYDALGNEISSSRANGITTTKTYDELGRINAITNQNGAGTLSRFSYQYDHEDNITVENSLKNGQEANKTYKYNAREELTEETANGVTTKYQYDHLGNKTEITDGNVTKSYSYTDGKLTKISENGKQTAISYDARGNMTKIVEKNNGKTNTENYTYDALDRLTEYQDNRYEYAYEYDGQDNRLSKSIKDNYMEQIEKDRVDSLTMRQLDEILDDPSTDAALEQGYERLRKQLDDLNNGATCEGGQIDGARYLTKYEYVNDPTKDNQEILSVYKSRGNSKPTPTQSEIYNHNDPSNPERIKTTINNQANYYLNSRNQSVEEIYDERGNKSQSQNYNTYGLTTGNNQIANNGGHILNPQTTFTYTGEQQDENNLIYLRARYYNPEIQTFITKDTYKGTIDSTLSQNQYIYTNNNPVRYVDPSGHFFFVIPALPAIGPAITFLFGATAIAVTAPTAIKATGNLLSNVQWSTPTFSNPFDSAKSGSQAKAQTKTGTASSSSPPPICPDPGKSSNLKNVGKSDKNNVLANELAKRFGYPNAEAFKKDFLPPGENVSHWNIAKDTKTGNIYLTRNLKGEASNIPTGLCDK